MLTFQYVYSEEHQAGFIVALFENDKSIVMAKQGSYGLSNRGWHSHQQPVLGDWNKLEEVKKSYGLDPFSLVLMECGEDSELINPHYRETQKEHFEHLLKVQTESQTGSYYVYDNYTNTIKTVSNT